jgi:hypothetical protein
LVGVGLSAGSEVNRQSWFEAGDLEILVPTVDRWRLRNLLFYSWLK